MNKFGQQAQPVINVPSQHGERQYLHNSEAGVKVPLAQTVVTALIVAVVVEIFMLLFDVLDGWKWAAGAGSLSLLGTWLIIYRHWFDLTRIENWTGLDINGDGEIGEPETRVVRIQMQRIEQNGHINVTRTFDLPIDEDELVTLAQGLIQGAPFSEREWAGKGNLLSSARFRDLRAAMIKRGLLEMVNDKDPRQGYRLTADGEAVMRDYADMADYE